MSCGNNKYAFDEVFNEFIEGDFSAKKISDLANYGVYVFVDGRSDCADDYMAHSSA